MANLTLCCKLLNLLPVFTVETNGEQLSTNFTHPNTDMVSNGVLSKNGIVVYL